MLSPQLLELLRDWWRIAWLQVWLFPGLDPINPMSTRQLNRACHAAAQIARSPSASPRILRHSSASTLSMSSRGKEVAGIIAAIINATIGALYEEALSDDIERGKDKIYRPKRIQDLLEHSVRRRWRQLALERLESVKPVLPVGKKFWALTPEEHTALVRLFEQKPIRAMVTGLQGRESSDAVTMVDAAYWIKGCSSLGRLRYAVMLRVSEGKGSAICLVDIKEGVTAAAPRAEGVAASRQRAHLARSGEFALTRTAPGSRLTHSFRARGVQNICSRDEAHVGVRWSQSRGNSGRVMANPLLVANLSVKLNHPRNVSETFRRS